MRFDHGENSLEIHGFLLLNAFFFSSFGDHFLNETMRISGLARGSILVPEKGGRLAIDLSHA